MRLIRTGAMANTHKIFTPQPVTPYAHASKNSHIVNECMNNWSLLSCCTTINLSSHKHIFIPPRSQHTLHTCTHTTHYSHTLCVCTYIQKYSLISKLILLLFLIETSSPSLFT